MRPVGQGEVASHRLEKPPVGENRQPGRIMFGIGVHRRSVQIGCFPRSNATVCIGEYAHYKEAKAERIVQFIASIRARGEPPEKHFCPPFGVLLEAQGPGFTRGSDSTRLYSMTCEPGASSIATFKLRSWAPLMRTGEDS